MEEVGTSGTSGTSEIEGDVTSGDVLFDTDAADSFEERAALVEYGAGVPREWAEGFARLNFAHPPMGFTPARWERVIDDGGRFLDRWAHVAAEAGWTALDVFGVHPTKPADRYDAMGLVPLIGGGEVTGVQPDRAVIRTPSGNCLIYYLRREHPEAVAIWEVSP